MEAGSLVGGKDGEHNDDGIVEISKTYEMQGTFLFEVEPFD